MALVVGTAFSGWLLLRASDLGGWVPALWALGVAVNYLPLSVYAVVSSRPAALDSELAGVDIGQELRRCNALQVWLFVPLSLLILATRDELTKRH